MAAWLCDWLYANALAALPDIRKNDDLALISHRK